MIGIVVAVVAFVLLPPVTDAALLRLAEPESLWSPFYWFLALVVLLVAAFGAARFIQLDRRYARRCP